jgi:hypothetical protein
VSKLRPKRQARQRSVSVIHPAAAHGSGLHINLGLFKISPIEGLKNCHTRPQEGKVIAMGNEKTKIDQFERSFPRVLTRHGSRSRAPMNDQRSEAAALPVLCSRPDAVRAMDQ